MSWPSQQLAVAAVGTVICWPACQALRLRGCAPKAVTNALVLRALYFVQGEATVPSTLGDELDTNPFLRPQDAGIRAAVKADADTPDWEVFGRVRTAKDNF